MNECSPTKKAFKILKLPAILLACLAVIGTLGSWYMAYAQSTATTAETLKTHTDDIAELKEDRKAQRVVDSKQTEILIRLEEFYKITQGRDYSLATVRADSIHRALNDSINGENRERDSSRVRVDKNKLIYTTDGFIILNGEIIGTIIPQDSGDGG